ncbi:unnamed protein product [Owenia fusiformis]|uniref:OTU domain-containing protein n=1 Tax=Owenia fusiformis TaxID=6347 RepID=A0A8S4NQI2_OWEFU|nr:unnamed protein product [Owenia fusiformis]
MGNSIDQWRCAIGRFNPCRQPNRCDNTERRAEREYRKALHKNKANQNSDSHESTIQKGQHLYCSDQKSSIKPNDHVDNLKRKAQELAKQCNEWFEVVKKGYISEKTTLKQNASVISTATAFQGDERQGVTGSDEKGISDQNNSLNYNIVKKEGPTDDHEEGKHPDQLENNTENVKVLMNQHWVESLRILPQLLVIISLLLIIGGVEVNPGPQTQGKDDAKRDTAPPAETDIFELLLSLFNSESFNLNDQKPLEPLEDAVTKHGLTNVENDGNGKPLECLVDVVAKHGLAIVENDGYGDCLFQALSHQLAYTKTANIDHRDLRQRLVEYVKLHPQLPNGDHVTTQFCTIIINEWTQYKNSSHPMNDDEKTKLAWYTESYMNRPGTWGDNLMIWAFTQLFNADVEIFSQGSENSYKIANVNSASRVIVRLGYVPQKIANDNSDGRVMVRQIHFISLVSLKELEEMFNLGKKISKCDQITQMREQAGYMCELGSLYTAQAQKTSRGWDFIYATALYNAALQRIKQSETDSSKEEVLSRFKHINAEYIIEQLQQIETYFLESVSKVKPDSTLSCTQRYRKVLEELRTYSCDTINNIHVNDMQIDGITFDMSDENVNMTIENSKIYYEKLSDKIVEFHRLVIDDCISVLGAPKVNRYAFIGLGSLARKEVTAWSDLESAIIYDPSGIAPPECNALRQEFRVLVHYFHMKVINLGETKINVLDIPVLCDFNKKLPKDLKDIDFFDEVTPQGICFDGTLPKASKHPFGRMSTKNPKRPTSFELIQPIDVIVNCQNEEVSEREGYHLSDVLMTSTFLYGDDSLWDEYNNKVHKILSSPSKTNQGLSIGNERGQATLKDDLDSYQRNPLSPRSFQTPVKTKHDIYRFATISINTLKLLHNCESVNPLDVLDELCEKEILHEGAKKDLQLMVCLAVNMRHLVYSRYDQQKESSSFIVPTQEQGKTSNHLGLVSVRDFPAICRFYATLLPWSEFLGEHSGDTIPCSYATRYFDSSDKVKELKEIFNLGMKISECDQTTHMREQAGYMCDLGSLYTVHAQKTSRGLDFIYATALYNAALQRIKQSETDSSKEEVLSRFKHINADYIIEQLQQIETYFLESVSKVNPDSTLSCTQRYRKVLEDSLRTYSRDTINNIHVNDMQIDGITFDMSDENVNRTIDNSRIYYEKLTDKIVEFHQLVIGDCISVLGAPKVNRWAFIGLGSLARKEVTVWSDLESAIIYDPSGITPPECNALRQEFRVLVHYFHMKVINLGETKINVLDIPVLSDFNKKLPKDLKNNDFFDEVTPQGICFDGTLPKASKHPFGRMSTKNPEKPISFELIQPIDDMVNCQNEEVSKREGYHLSDVLMTSTYLYGDDSLWNEYNKKVHKILSSPSKTNQDISIGNERGLATQKDDLDNYQRNPLSPKSFQKPVKTKHNIYRFATISINTLKLLHNCESFNPLDVLEELCLKKILCEDAKKDLQLMVCLAVNMRHLVYSRYDQQKEFSSFIVPTQEQGKSANHSELVSVRDFTAIYRFYATLIPWSEFLREQSGDTIPCSYATRYIDSSDNVKGELHSQMYFFENALKAFKKEELRLESMDRMEYSKELLDVKVNLAELHFAQGHHDESIKYLNESLILNEARPGLISMYSICYIWNALGNAYHKKGEHNDAIKYYKQSLNTSKLIHRNQQSQGISTLLGNIGLAYNSKGQYDEAIQYLEQSLTMQKKIYKDQPHPEIASSLGNIGSAYHSKGQYDEAIKYLEQSLTMRKKIYKDQPHPEIASSLGNIGTAYNSKGQYDEAIKYLEQSLIMQKKIYKDQPHPDIATSLGNIGSAYDSKGQYDEGIKYQKQSLTMRKLIYKDQPHPDIASSLGNIGTAYLSKGQYDEAIKYLEQSLIMRKKIYKDQPHPDIASSLGNIGSAYNS